MKISMFTNTYLPHIGGVARSVHTYEEELRSRGHSVSVVAPEFEGAEESTENVLRVPALQNFNGSDFSVRLAQPWLISDFLEQDPPDIIHTHHPFLLGDAALRASADFLTPVVFTHHTMYEQYTHYVPFDSPAMKRVAIQLATDFANLCDHVIAPSESIRSLLQRRGVTSPVTVIPTGIDLEYFASGDGTRLRGEYGIADDTLVIGHVGRLAEEKNLSYLAHSVGRFLRDRTDGIMLVVGDGDDRQQMEKILGDYLPQNRVVFTGALSGQPLLDAYAAMDLFVFASHSETQGMVLAEAAAAGNPIVALDAPGAREVVNEENGILLRSDAQEQEYAEALGAITDRTRLAQLKSSAPASVREFGLQSCTDRLCTLYSGLAGANTRRSADEINAWDAFLARSEMEWDLAVEKASALAAAFVDTRATSVDLI